MAGIDLIINPQAADEALAASAPTFYYTISPDDGRVISPPLEHPQTHPRHTLRLILATLANHYAFDYTCWAGDELHKYRTTPFPTFSDMPRDVRRMMVFGLLTSRQHGFPAPHGLEVGDQDYGVHYATLKSPSA